MDLIAFGGILFWLAIAAIIIWDIFALENDSGWSVAAGTVIGGFTLWFLSGKVNPLPWIYQHWATVLMIILAYVVLGAGWGIIKWWFFLHNQADVYETKRTAYQAEFDRVRNNTGYPVGLTYKDWVFREYRFPPSPATHKADITMWMVWWPLSGAWTLLNDPLKRLYRIIYQHLVSTYTRMANAVFASRFTELK